MADARQQERWKVIHGDFRSVLPVLGRVAAIVCDPPYGIAHPCDYGTRGRGSLAAATDYADVDGDEKPFDPAPLLALDVPTVLWGANYYADKLPPSGGWLVWDKRTQNDVGVNDQSDGELAWTNCVKGVRIFRHMWNGFWRDSERGTKYHPTQKPVALMSWVLALPWLPKCGLIFDPFAGSGPVGVACVRASADMYYLGCETNAEYVAIAERRIADAAAQGNLFGNVTRG